MHIEKLEHLIEVARTGSLSIAAQNLHISQPAISQSILKLEEELGVNIFNRSRRGVFPTLEGKQLIAKAHEVLLKFQELKEAALSLSSSLTGELKISMIPGLMPLILASLSHYHLTYPNVDLEISELSTEEVIAEMHQQRIDIGFFSLHEDIRSNLAGLRYEVLVKGNMKVYVSKHSPLACKGAVSPEELLKQTFVLYKGDHIKSFMQQLTQQYRPLKILFTSNNPEVIKTFVADGLGVSIAPDFAMNSDPYILSGQVVALELLNVVTTAQLAWAKSERKPLSKNADNFMQHLKSELNF